MTQPGQSEHPVPLVMNWVRDALLTSAAFRRVLTGTFRNEAVSASVRVPNLIPRCFGSHFFLLQILVSNSLLLRKNQPRWMQIKKMGQVRNP